MGEGARARDELEVRISGARREREKERERERGERERDPTELLPVHAAAFLVASSIPFPANISIRTTITYRGTSE
jgi:hypothetical protein